MQPEKPATPSFPPPEFDRYGYLPAGLHHWPVAQLRQVFVDSMALSTTRPTIFAGFNELQSCFVLANLHVTQWVNGSFTTSKINPGDLDVCNFICPDALDVLAPSIKQMVETYLQGKVTQRICHCDSYFAPMPALGEQHPDWGEYKKLHAYWSAHFGSDLADTPKGYVQLTLSPPPPPPAHEDNAATAPTTD